MTKPCAQTVPREATERFVLEEGAFCPRQFETPENAEAHRFGTAGEIIDQITGSTLDAVVSGVGTGGTLVGVYQGCRDRGIDVKPVAAIPPLECFQTPETCCFSGRIPGVIESMSTLYAKDAQRLGPDARVVTVFPDRMERYFSTELFGPKA